MSHAVHLYAPGQFPLVAIAKPIAQHIHDGGAALLIARSANAATLSEFLQREGIDLASSCARGKLTFLDAAQILERLRDGTTISKPRFDAEIAEVIHRLLADHPSLIAFGELVDLLCSEGRSDQAIELESYWNTLQAEYPFRLICAYELSHFDDTACTASFRTICKVHSHVATAPPNETADLDRSQLLAHLVQRSRALANEKSRTQRLSGERAQLKAEAETLHEHLVQLQQVTSALCEAVSLSDIGHVVATHMAAALSAVRVVVRRTQVACDGSATLAPLDTFASAVSENDSRLLTFAHGGVAAWPSETSPLLALPIVMGTQRYGAVLFELAAPRQLADEERELAQAFMRQLGLAMDRALTYELAEQAKTIAERANSAKDEFLALLGHELRNPLAPMLTAVELMKLKNGDFARQERSVLERQLSHMIRLVDDLLDISRLTRGTLLLNREPVELARVFNDARELVAPLFEERAHELVAEIPEHGLSVDADAHRIAQAIANLLTNAAKFTACGGVIRATVKLHQANVVLSICDNGVGMDADRVARLFTPFEQSQQPIDRKAGGLGLGLAVARGLVESHGGKVFGFSEGRGKGSTFSIELPLAKKQAALSA